MPKGGKRTGAGRPKTKIASGIERSIHDNKFAARVLGRISELGLPDVKNAEDYALHLLKWGDARIRKEVFMDLFHCVEGRAPIAEPLKPKDDRDSVQFTVEFIGGEA